MRRARWATLAGVYVLFALHALHAKWAGTTLAPVEPSEALRTLHLGVVTVGFLFGVAAIAATAVFGRFFCGWGCHLLLLQELASKGLRRLGWRPEHPTLRVYGLFPVALAVYLYAWPELLRMAQGAAWPGLHVDPDPRWGSWLTDTPYRSFPGLGLGVLTLLAAGPGLVAVLGDRAFCRTACPYGVFFGVADRFAPVRPTVSDACTGCDRCTRACLSGIRVLDQLRAEGAVRDPACLRDLDCVAACPTGALTLRRAPVRPWRTGPRAAPPTAWGAELLAGAGLLGTFVVWRGLYGVVPVLLAAPLALATVALVLRVRAGGAWRVAGVAWSLLFAHSAVIRGAELVAERSASPLPALRFVETCGLYASPALHARLASALLATGDRDGAADELRAVLRASPDDAGARRVLATLAD